MVLPINQGEQTSPPPTYQEEQQQRADECLESILGADSPQRLRADWELYGPKGADRYVYLKPENFIDFRDKLTSKLVELGMDPESDDDRISELLGRLNIPPRDKTVESGSIYVRSVLDSVDRLIGAIDPRAEGFTLLPFEDVKIYDFFRGDYPRVPLNTEDCKLFCINFAFPHEYGPKATRFISDVDSPYDGYIVYYDGYPESVNQVPNVTVFIPTSRLKLEDIMKLDRSTRSMRNLEFHGDPHYIPPYISVRSTSNGEPNFTTPTVDAFLTDLHAYSEEQRGKGSQTEFR